MTFDNDGLKIHLCAYHLKSNKCGLNTFSHNTCGLSCRKWLVCRTNLLCAYHLKCGLNTYSLYTCGLPCRRWLVCRKILLCSYHLTCGLNTHLHNTCGLSCCRWFVCRKTLLCSYHLKCGLNITYITYADYLAAGGLYAAKFSCVLTI